MICLRVFKFWNINFLGTQGSTWCESFIRPNHTQDVPQAVFWMRSTKVHSDLLSSYYLCLSSTRYTRNLVDEGNGRFNLILLCWSQGQISSVHDHSQAHCFMKMLQGSLTEVRYENPKETKQSSEDHVLDRPLSETGRTELNENDVCYINGKLYNSRSFFSSLNLSKC